MEAAQKRLWNKDFSLVVVGQIISLFGNTILRFALSMYILDVTGSATIFGSITAIAMIPTIMLTPIGGMIADRVNRRNIMVVLDFTTAALIFVFSGLLSMSNGHVVPLIGVSLVLLSIIQSFYTPSVQASVPVLQASDNLVRANAIVNQVAMLANMAGPVLGGLLYGIMGAKPIIVISGVCFFLSAVLELFIHIPFERQPHSTSLIKTIKHDFRESVHFVVKEQPSILRAMLLVASLNFFITSMMMVGMPYLIRIKLGLGSELYGIASGCMAGAGLFGGLLCAVIAKRFQVQKLHLTLIACGLFLLPVGMVFFATGLTPMAVFFTLTICAMLIQLSASIFSIFGLSAIQKKTPVQMLGKVMAYVLTLAMCAQPVGYAFYGFLFDLLPGQIYIVILATAAIVAAIGVGSTGICRQLGTEEPGYGT